MFISKINNINQNLKIKQDFEFFYRKKYLSHTQDKKIILFTKLKNMNKMKKLSHGVNKNKNFVHKIKKYEQKFDFFEKKYIFIYVFRY